jgi:hypothetical protein
MSNSANKMNSTLRVFEGFSSDAGGAFNRTGEVAAVAPVAADEPAATGVATEAVVAVAAVAGAGEAAGAATAGEEGTGFAATAAGCGAVAML